MSDYYDIINTLSSQEYYKLKLDIVKLVNDSNFINSIVEIKNPIAFDHFIKMAEYKTDTSKIYEKRNRFIRKSLLALNKENIYDFFDLNDYEDIRKEIIANRYLTEYIICYYFQDNYYNLMANFHQMNSYLRSCKKSLIDKDHLKIYNEFVNLNNLPFDDKIKLFNKYLDNDLMGLFYDDMNIVRDDSHKELVDSTLKLNHKIKEYSKDISERLGVDVYILDGEEFYGFVRSLSIESSLLSDKSDYVNSVGESLGYNFSYIGDKNIGTIDYDNKYVTLFYDNIDYKKIMYVHHSDMHSKKMNNQNDYLSEKENEILTPSSLIAYTNNYNDIYIKALDDGIKPTALICYDKITHSDISFAKKYDLAILVINREKYKRYETYDDDYEKNTYVL